MNFEYQLSSHDCEEASLAVINRSSEAESRTVHKWVLLIGVFFFLMGIILKEKGFLVVGVSLLSLPIFCKLFVQTNVEEIYKYDEESGMVIKQDRETGNLANSTNYGEPMTVQVIGEGLILNTPSWQGTFKWENFHSFSETNNLLAIYGMPSLYHVSDSNFIIPKRAFSEEEQLSDFRELLCRNIGKRRYNLLQKMQKSLFNLKSKI